MVFLCSGGAIRRWHISHWHGETCLKCKEAAESHFCVFLMQFMFLEEFKNKEKSQQPVPDGFLAARPEYLLLHQMLVQQMLTCF